MSRNRYAVYCPACGSDRVYRLERKGLVQKTVYPIFGLYPWQCKKCLAEVMLRKRHRLRRKHVAV